MSLDDFLKKQVFLVQIESLRQIDIIKISVLYNHV